MLLDQTLEVVTIAAWLILAVSVIVFLVRTTLREGFGVAVRRLFSRTFISVVVFVVIPITLLSESLVFIEPQEVGVVVSLATSEGYRDRPFRSGLHWVIPLAEQVFRYPIYWQTYTMSSKPLEGAKLSDDAIVARTRDGQEVSIDCSIIFQIDSEQAIRVHIEWQKRYIDDFVRPLLRGLVRTKVSQYTVSEVNSDKRGDLEQDLSKEIQLDLEDKGFIMDRFLLRNITFSPQYASAVEAKQVAEQNITEKKYQAAQMITIAEAEARASLIKAQAEADALKLIAEALERNPNLVTYRYVEKLSPGVKVMLVPNNAPYFLPTPSLEDTPLIGPSPAPTSSVTAALTTTLPITVTP